MLGAGVMSRATVPTLEPHCGSWICTLEHPDGQSPRLVEVYSRKDAETLAFAGAGSEATCTAALAGGLQFGETLIDGRFPDWQRVLPRNMSGVPGQYNAEYLYDAAAALALHGACKDVVGARVAYNGHDSACVVYAPHCEENMAYCIIMPVRADHFAIGKDLSAFIGLEV